MAPKEPETRNQKPETRNQKPETRNQKPETRNQKPETRNQKPETRNQKPETRNQKPETRNHNTRVSGSRGYGYSSRPVAIRRLFLFLVSGFWFLVLGRCPKLTESCRSAPRQDIGPPVSSPQSLPGRLPPFRIIEREATANAF